MLAVNCSRNANWEAVKAPNDASSITAFTRSSNRTGNTITFLGTAWNKPERTAMVTCVTVTNGVKPNFSFDQYRKSSAPGSGLIGNSRRCSASPGTSAPM